MTEAPAAPLRRRVRDTGGAVAGTAAVGLAQWGIVAVLAHAGGPADVGAYALALACSAPLFTCAMLQLRVLWVTEGAGGPPFSTYLKVRLVCAGAALVVLAVLSRVIGGEPGTALLPLALARGADAVGDLYLGRLQRAHRMDLVGLAQVTAAVLAFGAYWTATHPPAAIAPLAPLTALWVLPATAALAGLVLPVLLARRSAPLPDAGPLRPGRRDAHALVRVGLPLGLASMVASVTASVPRFFLQGHRGTAEVGVFSALGQLGQGVSAVAGAVAQAMLPETARRYRTQGRPGLLHRVRAAVLGCATLGLLAALVGAGWGPGIVRTVYGAGFAVDRGTVVLLVVLTGLTCLLWFLDQALITLRQGADQLRLNLATLLVTALGCAVAVPAYGVPGALAAATAGAGFQCAAKLYAVRGRRR